MENTGYIKLHRKIQESDIWFKPPEWLKIFIYILWKVNWKKGSLEIGTGRFTYKEISDSCGVTIGQIDKFIRWSKSVDMISTNRSIKHFTISVTNYSQYQEIENTTKSTTSRQTVDRQSTAYIIYKKKEERNNNSDILFDDFWNIYPRKIGKPKALLSFQKIKDTSNIINGTKKWIAYWKKEDTNIQYIPHPTTFLNGERYNDDCLGGGSTTNLQQKQKEAMEALNELTK